jgi:hypothetical protein
MQISHRRKLVTTLSRQAKCAISRTCASTALIPLKWLVINTLHGFHRKLLNLNTILSYKFTGGGGGLEGMITRPSDLPNESRPNPLGPDSVRWRSYPQDHPRETRCSQRRRFYRRSATSALMNEVGPGAGVVITVAFVPKLVSKCPQPRGPQVPRLRSG